MAKRLIDADAAAERLSFEGVMQYPQSWGMGVLAAISTIRSLPTVDAVEVVRCSQCKHWEPHCNGNAGICPKRRGVAKADDFCSYGERRKELFA